MRSNLWLHGLPDYIAQMQIPAVFRITSTNAENTVPFSLYRYHIRLLIQQQTISVICYAIFEIYVMFIYCESVKAKQLLVMWPIFYNQYLYNSIGLQMRIK